MKTSDNGLRVIMEEEGCILHTYQDQAGYDTIGVGHLIQDGEDIPDQITKEEALDLLAQDVQAVEDEVNELGWVLTQNQFDALVDFGFNCGTGALRQLTKHGFDEVPNQLPRWNKARGRVIQALVNRRAREVEMWAT